ncbi:MAG: hypothetical protein RI953_1517 [Pseudomonadota bacterium]|jgi:hypothetical protein
MSSRSIVHDLRFLTIPLTFCFIPFARADGFRCEHQSGGVEPVLICSDDGVNAGDAIARVFLRKMPRWGVHAGLTVVDLCVERVGLSDPKKDDSFQIDGSSDLKKASNPSAPQCERRYCTDVKRLHSFSVNSVPFPVGWTSISFWLGYQHRSFSIRCDALVSNTEIDGGAGL